MQINIEVNTDGILGEPETLIAFAHAAEAAGICGFGFSDHPAPSRKWLEAGGHSTYDPFAALAFLAAATESLRLMTYLAVLPYRNPLVTLKSLATVDRLSNGRFTMVVGSGYLRSEFLALGSSFADRGRLTDEALRVFRSFANDGSVSFDGDGFEAIDQVCYPLPSQRPLPPIWIGGSGRRSRERVAKFGQGWSPILGSDLFARVTRTEALSSLDSLADAVEDLNELLQACGRDSQAVSIQLGGAVNARSAVGEPDGHAEMLARLSEIGVTHVITRIPSDAEAAEGLELIAALGETFA